MTQYGFYYDASRCTGCKTCSLACKDAKNLNVDEALRNVCEYGAATWSCDEAGCWSQEGFVYYVSAACNHCANPACVAACPAASMMKDEETGLVFNDPATCIGCGACAMACPYGAPSVYTRDDAPVSIKCDGCYERVVAGKAPICVESCPLRALEFGDIEELRAAYGDCAAIAPLAGPEMTNPSLVIKPCANAEAYDAATGEIMNVEELF